MCIVVHILEYIILYILVVFLLIFNSLKNSKVVNAICVRSVARRLTTANEETASYPKNLVFSSHVEGFYEVKWEPYRVNHCKKHTTQNELIYAIGFLKILLISR